MSEQVQAACALGVMLSTAGLTSWNSSFAFVSLTTACAGVASFPSLTSSAGEGCGMMGSACSDETATSPAAVPTHCSYSGHTNRQITQDSTLPSNLARKAFKNRNPGA